MNDERLDASAIVHMTSRGRGYTNTFQVSATLCEPVDPHLLQQALECIAPRFSALPAGIRRGRFQYEAVPALPQVRPEMETLAPMSDAVLEHCALRVLYRGCKISVEVFHALTDGFGGLSFLKALVAEYAALAWGISCDEQGTGASPTETVTEDDTAYAGETPLAFNRRGSWRIPRQTPDSKGVHTVTGICALDPLLEAAHRFGVSLTALLAGTLASSVAELQARYGAARKGQAIQILVPADLRRRFPSHTLRNFSLYALPRLEPEQFRLPPEEIAGVIDRQLKRQLSREHLAGLMASQARLQNRTRHVPLFAKEAVMRMVHRCFVERNSCLSLSNLGRISFPEALRPYVRRAGFLLTPRRNMPYNCGVTSYDGRLYIGFTRRGAVPELETCFFRRMEELGLEAELEVDGIPSTLGEMMRTSASRYGAQTETAGMTVQALPS